MGLREPERSLLHPRSCLRPEPAAKVPSSAPASRVPQAVFAAPKASQSCLRRRYLALPRGPPALLLLLAPPLHASFKNAPKTARFRSCSRSTLDVIVRVNVEEGFRA